MEEVEIFVGDDAALSGNIFPGPREGEGKQPAVLLIHGWQSGQDRWFDTARMFSERLGLTCLTLDLRGHGKSPGDLDQLSRKDFLNDVVAAYDFLAKRNDVDPQRIGVVGSSFGGYLGALLSSKRHLVWIVLRVPADYPNEGFDVPRGRAHSPPEVNAWRAQVKNWESTDALKAIHSFRGKVLIIESGKDREVPQQTVLNYKNAVSDERDLKYVIMENAPHSLTGHPELKKKLNEIIFDWWQKKSGPFAYTKAL